MSVQWDSSDYVRQIVLWQPHMRALLNLLALREPSFLEAAPGWAYALSEMSREMDEAGYRLATFSINGFKQVLVNVKDDKGEDAEEFQGKWHDRLSHTCELCGSHGEYVRLRKLGNNIGLRCPLCAAPSYARMMLGVVAAQSGKALTKKEDVPGLLLGHLETWMQKTGRQYLVARGGGQLVGGRDMSAFNEFLLESMNMPVSDEE